MNTNTMEIIDRGLQCLSDNLGARETEIFISVLLRERFDYTQWRKTFVDRIGSFEDLDRLSESVKEKSVFNGNPGTIVL